MKAPVRPRIHCIGEDYGSRPGVHAPLTEGNAGMNPGLRMPRSELTWEPYPLDTRLK